MEYLLSTDCLTKKFKMQTAVDHITVHIGRGEIYGMIGKNGAGKTTFLKMICGLSAPTAGISHCLDIMALNGKKSFPALGH